MTVFEEFDTLSDIFKELEQHRFSTRVRDNFYNDLELLYMLS